MLTLNFDGLHWDANKIQKPRFGELGQCLPLWGSSDGLLEAMLSGLDWSLN